MCREEWHGGVAMRDMDQERDRESVAGLSSSVHRVPDGTRPNGCASPQEKSQDEDQREEDMSQAANTASYSRSS